MPFGMPFWIHLGRYSVPRWSQVGAKIATKSAFPESFGKKYFKDLCNFNSIQNIDGAEFKLNDIVQNGELRYKEIIKQIPETIDSEIKKLIYMKTD